MDTWFSLAGWAGQAASFRKTILKVITCRSILTGAIIPVIYVHAVLLLRKGINGWKGEPKGKYYEFRGWWNKNIFGEDIEGENR